MIYKDYIRVLYVHMDTGKIRIEERKDLMDYLGGVGVASKLLEENMHPELPPLHPDQPVVFACGALTYVFPVITKTVAMFISPLTGELGESYAGGRLAAMMFSAGYDAIVILGKAEKPSFLSIHPHDVRIVDARVAWGTGHDEYVGHLLRNIESKVGKRSVLRIGPAGENLVAYAGVIVDRYRHFGRLGLGACLGSKHVKAITVGGGLSIPVKNQGEYVKTYREIFNKCTDTDMMAKYHDAGTPINIKPLNLAGGLPTKNLQKNRYEHADKISGERFTEDNLVRKMACLGCPVGCIHIGQFRREFADHGHEYEVISVGYDYELIYALGTFLCIDNTDAILELIDAVEEAGLDAMSTGVALGWATEAFKKGLITLKDTIVPLHFGQKDPYIAAIKYIASAINDFYRNLGKGSRYASELYGGEEFAMQVAGNEMAGYHTGYGSLIGAAIGARHSHLCNGGYSIDQSLDGKFDEDDMLDRLEKEEIERCMLNSLVMCLFARKVYDRPTVLSALKAIGRELTNEDLDDIALRNYKTKLRIKQKLGFSLENVKLPKRFFETESLNGQLDEETAHRMLEKYQKRIEKVFMGDA